MSVIVIIDGADEISANYHSGGSVAAVAESEDAARELLAATDYVKLTDKEWSERIVYALRDPTEPRVFVFPDAGCC